MKLEQSDKNEFYNQFGCKQTVVAPVSVLSVPSEPYSFSRRTSMNRLKINEIHIEFSDRNGDAHWGGFVFSTRLMSVLFSSCVVLSKS